MRRLLLALVLALPFTVHAQSPNCGPKIGTLSWGILSRSPASTPTFSPAPGNYSTPQTVTVSSSTTLADLYLSTDGVTWNRVPNPSTVTVSSSQTLRATAGSYATTLSSVATAAYVLQAAVATISPPGGTYSGSTTVTLASATGGASIRYTTDGSTPGPTSRLYTAPFSITGTMMIRAYAAAAGFTDSSVTSATFTNTEIVQVVTFTTPGCYASGTTMNGVTVSTSRAGVSSYVTNAGALADCAANNFVVTGWGVAGQAARGPNLYASPESPASQTITLGSTGYYTISAWGHGSQTFTAGTVTASGLPCTVTQGLPCTINVTGTGNMTAAAPVPTLSFVQVEAGQWDTMPIRSGTRNADSVSFTPTSLTNATNFCIGADVQFEGAGRLQSTGNSTYFMMGTGAGANSAYMTGSYWSIQDGAGAQRYISHMGSTQHASSRLVACTASGTLSVQFNGTDVSGGASGAGNGYFSSQPSAMPVGGTSTAGAVFMRNITLCQGANAKASCATEIADPYAIGCFGDSITVGGSGGTTYSFPQRLAYMAGPPWTAWNYGVNGTRTDQIATSFTTRSVNGRYGAVVIWGGINDFQQGYDTTHVFDRLQAIYDSALASGTKLIPVTITPCGGLGWCTAAVTGAIQAVNAKIMNYCATHGIACADAYTFFADDTGAIRAPYNGDNLHLTQAGTDKAAILIYNAGRASGYWQ